MLLVRLISTVRPWQPLRDWMRMWLISSPVREIGAINTQRLLTPDLRVRAIDLHSSHPSIERSDFFSLPHGGPADVATGTCTPYEVVVC